MQILVLCPSCGADNRVDETRSQTQEPVCGRCKVPLALKASGHPVTATDASFDKDVTQSGVPTLVDFWAEWCGPCRVFEPTLVDFARSTAGQVRIVKVNVDDSPRTAQKYGIQSIPTLVLFRGQEVARMSGARSLDQLKQFVGQHGVKV